MMLRGLYQVMILGVWLMTAGAASGAETSPETAQTKEVAMQVESAYPIVVTSRLAECRDFYVRQLRFKVVFDSSWFVYLAAGSNDAYGVAFMTPNHPSQPPGPDAFNGKGMFLTLQVADAAAEFERLTKAGAFIAYPIKDEPWGQRRFGLFDPAGMWIDVVQQIEPAPGFWDKYVQPEPDSEKRR